MATRRKKRLLVIGGAEDPDESDMRILPRLVELAGGRKARLLVCAVATEEPDESLEAYEEVFKKIGVAEVIPVSLRERIGGEYADLLEALERATAFFMSGGDQLRITSILAGTPFAEQLKRRHDDGLLIAGTSAGAAAMSSTMISSGEPDTVHRSAVGLSPGLAYWPDTAVDTHFDRRGRVHRLMAVFAQNPQILGVGIDEDTAVEVVPDERFTVLGKRTVMVFDGRVSHTSPERLVTDEPIALAGCTVHVLPAGYGFDLQRKQVALPDGTLVPSS